jgi:UDP-N-acetylmuramyl pentapeptide phosphotransferase/UDP-N-acetylglucosamine-1-phosphate transferase
MMYLIVAIVLFVLELVYFRLADRFNIIDKPNERSSHTVITLRGGGVIFFLGAWVYTVACGFAYPWFMAGLTLISVISFVDDMHSLSPKLRLTLHFVAMLLMFMELGLLEADKWWQILIALIVCTGCINVFNFMDGINGITGGYSLVILGALMYVDRCVVNFVDVNFLDISAISVIVFCFFNFRKRAKCFAGDVGSVSIAFILLFFLGKLILKTGDVSWFVFMAVYGVDGVLTIIHRLMLHENVSLPHRKHAYQIMANELKLPHVVVSSIYMAIQALACIIYLLFPGYLTFGITVLVLSVAYVIFMKKFFCLHLMNNNV